MPFVNLTKDQWNVVATTTVDTVFQNRSSNPIFTTPYSTTSLPIDEGFLLYPGDSIVYGEGLDIEASTVVSDGDIYYSDVK